MEKIVSDRTRNSARARAGREAKHFGDAHESWIEGQLNAAVMLGILAHWCHTEPKTKYISGKLTHVEKSAADYVGVLEGVDPDRAAMVGLPSYARSGGRTLAVEAKSVKGDCMPRSIVSKKQAEHLEAVARAGGFALLVGEFRLDTVRVRFACPWLEVPWEVKRSAESVSPILMAPWSTASWPDCFLLRWHPGGPRSSSWSSEPKRLYPTE